MEKLGFVRRVVVNVGYAVVWTFLFEKFILILRNGIYYTKRKNNHII